MKRTPLALVGVLLLSAGATGALARALRPAAVDAETASVVEFARRVADDLAARRYDAVWAALAPGSRARLEASHTAFLTGVRPLVEPPAGAVRSDADERRLAAIEREHGVERGELLSTAADGMWTGALARVLDPEGRYRAFASSDVERILLDGPRASVDVRLGDGRTQNFALVRDPDTGTWALADFVPYCPASGYLKDLPPALGTKAPAPAPSATPPAPLAR